MQSPALATLTLTGALATVSILTPCYAAKPSFDCAKARGEIETLICQDDDLAALDRTLADVYKKALDQAPPDDLKTLKAFQRGWVKGRNDCWKAEADMHYCVQHNYEARITELQIMYADAVSDTVTFTCAGGAIITAVFYQDTQLPAAVLTRIPDQVIALLTPSGSGSKYEGGNVTFWLKGDQAQVSWNGEEWQCQQQ